MIKPFAIAILGLCAATTASFAQSTSPKSATECQQLWATADANKDNKLDMAELEANKAQMPASLMKGSTTGSTTGTSDTTGSTTGSTSSASGSAAGSTTGMMVSQQDFMTACTTGQ